MATSTISVETRIVRDWPLMKLAAPGALHIAPYCPAIANLMVTIGLRCCKAEWRMNGGPWKRLPMSRYNIEIVDDDDGDPVMATAGMA
jgi:hypothetical protein